MNSALSFVNDHLGIKKSDFLYEMVNAFLGCNYPYPPRMLPICEEITMHYLQRELYHHSDAPSRFDLFATEGGTAAMTYIFQSMKINNLLGENDKVAMITPIFSPYLEIPELPEYGYEVVHIHADKENNWQVTKEGIPSIAQGEPELYCMLAA